MLGCWLAKRPLPDDALAEQITSIFSPRDNLKALDWYAEQATGAHDALFMTFAFGMNKRFQDAYRDGTAKLRYALMEAMSGPTKNQGAEGGQRSRNHQAKENESEQVRDWIALG